MNDKKQLTIHKDEANSKIFIRREFDAPLAEVWEAWTNSEILDAWWAPRPWKARTKSMDFKEGGVWLYCMEGPEGEQHWARVDFEQIVPQKSFSGEDSFCDENGNKTPEPPGMHWKNEFTATDKGTQVSVEITFANKEALAKILEMGFEEGFTAALGNLDEVLATK